jgi:hypothetical protein
MMALLALAVGIRLSFFSGYVLGDDGIYALQALAHARLHAWPPAPNHWATRLGITMPTTLALLCFGDGPLTYVLYPLIISTLGIPLCFRIARTVADEQTGWLAAIFMAVFPQQFLYSTQLFPDLIVGFFATLSIWNWILALRSERIANYLLTGLFFGVAYLCRETIIIEGPTYLAIWAYLGKLRRPRIVWTFALPVLILAGEFALYGFTAGTPWYRLGHVSPRSWTAGPDIGQQLAHAAGMQQPAGLYGGGFWTDPFLMLVGTYEFGLYYILAVFLCIVGWVRWPAMRLLVIWLTVSFLATYFGTTDPRHWSPLYRFPRYAAGLCIPTLILVAYGLNRLPAVWCRLTSAALIASGLFAASLDYGSTSLGPHRKFIQSRFAMDACMDPREYFAARWVQGIDETPTYVCSADDSGSKNLDALPACSREPRSASKYFVVSKERSPGLFKKMVQEGWKPVEEIPGVPTPSRAAVARLLWHIPSQKFRAQRIAQPPGLTILENPVFLKADE